MGHSEIVGKGINPFLPQGLELPDPLLCEFTRFIHLHLPQILLFLCEIKTLSQRNLNRFKLTHFAILVKKKGGLKAPLGQVIRPNPCRATAFAQSTKENISI